MLDAMIAQLIKQNLKDQQALGHHSGTIKTVAAVAPHHPTEEDHIGLRLIRLLCYSCVHIPCHSWHVERYPTAPLIVFMPGFPVKPRPRPCLEKRGRFNSSGSSSSSSSSSLQDA